MPSHDITFCIQNGKCINTACERHASKAPIGVMLSWANFWNSCANKKAKPKKHNIYPRYKGKQNG